MTFAAWKRIAWTYHLVFAAAVTWPLQTLVNTPKPYVLGLPLNMAWCAAWIVGSLIVMWRLDAARSRHVRQRLEGADPQGSAGPPPGPGGSGPSSTHAAP